MCSPDHTGLLTALGFSGGETEVRKGAGFSPGTATPGSEPAVTFQGLDVAGQERACGSGLARDSADRAWQPLRPRGKAKASAFRFWVRGRL